ncbi:MAG: GNAT family N-acetyltransferase [Hyphomicrobiales bacterium]|nr:GNAT family N-acetyltransferase [Hyphomicrobiales bacterium]
MAAAKLDFRFDFAHTPAGRAELARLIRDEFEIDVTPLDRLGHDPSVVAFGWWAGDELVANVSLYGRTLWLAGEPTPAFGLQSVVVRPAWRGHGLFRDLMTRALAFADARAPRVTLSTETPELYRRFGFRDLAETVFRGPLRPAAGAPNARRLSLADDADVALVRALYARREPTSRLCAACDHPAPFFLKTLESPEIALHHLPDLDAIVAIEETTPEVLTLLDVVAADIPPLATIAAALGAPIDEAEVHLTPDRLAWTPAREEPDDAGAMVRGPWPLDRRAVAFSPMQV